MSRRGDDNAQDSALHDILRAKTWTAEIRHSRRTWLNLSYTSALEDFRAIRRPEEDETAQHPATVPIKDRTGSGDIQESAIFSALKSYIHLADQQSTDHVQL